MSVQIIIPPSEIWDYFKGNATSLGSHMHKVAGNPEYGIEIFVTDDLGCPSIVVTADDIQIYEETVVNKYDCEKTAEKVYDDYLTKNALTKFVDEVSEDELTKEEIEDEIYQRESELDCAVCDFIIAATQDNMFYGAYDEVSEDMIQDIKEHFLEYMARKHGLSIYRPMVLEYDDGTEEISDYPYEDMEFDDPNNPLYKS